jgi:signal transduction histidine kinase
MQVTKKAFDVSAAVQDIATDIRRDAEHKGLSFSLSSSGPLNIVGDEGKLRRMVFRTLMDNAVRYTKSGSVHVELSQKGAEVTFAVHDTGVGISPEDMRKLFTEGGKGTHAEVINPESTGYGLFVAKSIVDAHGGRIWAESNGEGKGATFFVELPSRA